MPAWQCRVPYGFVPVLTSIVTTLTVSVASAACLPAFPIRSITSTTDYARALVDSLGLAKQGFTRGAPDPNDGLGVIVYKIKLADEDYRCATQELMSFQSSSNAFVAKGAEVVVGAYELLLQTDQQIVNTLVAALDEVGTNRPPALGRLTEQLAALQVRQDQVWKLLPVSVATATYGLVLFTDQGEPTGRLQLTRSQRGELRMTLERTFGPSVRQGPQVGQWAVDAAGALFYQFLADPQWRSADD